MGLFSRTPNVFSKGVIEASKVDTGGAIVPYQTTVKKATSSVKSKKDTPCLEALLVQLHGFSKSGWFSDSVAWKYGMPLNSEPFEVVKGHTIKFTKKGIIFNDNGVKRELTWEEMGNIDKIDPANTPALLRPDTAGNTADTARARAALAGQIDGLAYALKLPKNVVSLYFPGGKLSTIAERIEHFMLPLGGLNQELSAATVQGNDLKKAAKEIASDMIDRIGTHLSAEHEDDLTEGKLNDIIAAAIDEAYMKTVVDRLISKKTGIPQAKKDAAKAYILSHTAPIALGDAKTLEDQILNIFAEVVPNPLSPKHRADYNAAANDDAKEALIVSLMGVGATVSEDDFIKAIKEELTTDDDVIKLHRDNLIANGFITEDTAGKTVTRVK